MGGLSYANVPPNGNTGSVFGGNPPGSSYVPAVQNADGTITPGYSLPPPAPPAVDPSSVCTPENPQGAPPFANQELRNASPLECKSCAQTERKKKKKELQEEWNSRSLLGKIIFLEALPFRATVGDPGIEDLREATDNPGLQDGGEEPREYEPPPGPTTGFVVP
jgi:hypothetical protein